MAAFPGSLSTLLGERFVRRMLQWYVDDERGVLFHIREDVGDGVNGSARVTGYCGGVVTLRPGLLGAVSSITQYAFWDFVLAYLRRPWLLAHPENLKRLPTIWRNLRLRAGLGAAPAVPSAQANPRPAEAFVPFMGLVVIGVRPERQGAGLGSRMLMEFERLARANGQVHCIQLSVRADNAQAIRSYRRNGWDVDAAGQESLRMAKRF